MKKSSHDVIHVICVLLLLLWGGVMLYFYANGRIVHYLPPDGIFRPMVLWSGIGMVALGLFNLATLWAKEADCGHDHGEGGGCCGHDDHHHPPHHHDHGHAVGCCGGKHEPHAHQHDHDDAHDHAQACCAHEHHHGHGHAHEEPKHEHAAGCCGHDHDHDHEEETAEAKGDGHVHAHGILYESGLLGRAFAVFIIAVPVAYAAVMTPDQFSPHAVVNKGLYHQNYGSTARADEFSLKKAASSREPVPAAAADAPGGEIAVNPQAADAPPRAQGAPVGVPSPTADKVPETKGQEAKSYGNFTLKDLEAQIPKSPEGNFMLEVPEIYYTAGDAEVQNVLSGQPVETVAQILPEKSDFNPDGTRARIFRMMVQCCAADARPYSIPVEFGRQAPKFKDMSWVKISGVMSYEDQNGQTVPLIKVSAVAEAAAPDDRMVY